MNWYEKNPFVMDYDGLIRGYIFSDKFEDFDEFEETKSSSVIDIVEIKDTACDARFPGGFKLSDSTRHKNLSSFEKLSHRSKIPRITKSSTRKSHNSLFPHQGSEIKIKIPKNISNERSVKRSKLPIRETPSDKLLEPTINKNLFDPPHSSPQTAPPVNLPLKILESEVSNDSTLPEKSKLDESSSIHVPKNHQKAQQIGATIGKKITTLLEHIKKKQISSDSSSPSDNAISIMKRVLRRDITTKNIPKGKKNIYPQFYIGSSPSELKLFRLGDEWTNI